MLQADQKVQATLKGLRELKKKQAAPKTEEELTFTSAKTRTRKLKKSMKAGKCRLKRYALAEAALAIADNTLDTEKPFVVTGGVYGLAELRATFTARKMKEDRKTELFYLNPKQAKEQAATKAGEVEGADGERFQPLLINFAKFFATCFGPKKVPGSGTEHCEQVLVAGKVQLLNASNHRARFPAFESMMNLQRIEESAGAMLGRANEGGAAQEMLANMLNTKAKPKQDAAFLEQEGALLGSGSSTVVLGSAGSGGMISKQPQGSAVLDGLVHGSRRWLFISQENLIVLQNKAAEALEASSAYMFFEEQITELIEQHGLNDLEHYQCQQEEGDAVFVPPTYWTLKLATEDSLSLQQQLLPGPAEVAAHVDQKVFAPELNSFNLAVCYGQERLAELPGWKNAEEMQQVGMSISQQFSRAEAANWPAMSMMALCGGVLELHPAVPVGATKCAQVWKECGALLKGNNAKHSGGEHADWPSWLGSESLVADLEKARGEAAVDESMKPKRGMTAAEMDAAADAADDQGAAAGKKKKRRKKRRKRKKKA